MKESSRSLSLIEMLDSRRNEFSVLPTVAVEALSLADTPDASMSDFAKLVERDVSLASEMIRTSNGALYARRSEVLSVHEAVHVLGFRQCKNLLITSCVSGMMKNVDIDEAWIRDTLWRHSYLTGMVALNLNHVLKLGFCGEEFTAGLLHDIGRTLLAVMLPDKYLSFDDLTFREEDELRALEIETMVLGTSHAELGAHFVSTSGLPEPLRYVAEFHHNPEDAPVWHQPLVSLITAADHIANHLQFSGAVEEYEPQTNMGIRLLDEIKGGRLAKRFARSAHGLMDQSLQQLTDAKVKV